ncbi:unnamed protein product [Linum trigynum]|uniref:Uncharacterized protein n=1 Tax=Linum trigynum TaxID=586398 RepID=A0AAV2EM58_9ROSI
MVCLVQTISDRTVQMWSGLDRIVYGLVHGMYSNLSVWTTNRIYGLVWTGPHRFPPLITAFGGFFRNVIFSILEAADLGIKPRLFSTDNEVY